MGLINKLKRFLGLVDEDEFEAIDESLGTSSKVFPITSRKKKEGEPVTVFIYGLNNFSEVQRVVNEVKLSKIVLVNFESASKEEAVKALDFVSGAIYALEGRLEKIGDYVFLAVPKGIDVEDSTLTQDTYPHNTSRI
ncbi:MAG TPA: cell division protein SepF [bacterium]|jgi:cell division inhibitor SepF|nr:cell division protein SepF [Dictyoglomota bacterium]HHV81593.1 cell division protein SepF [bacterium]HOK29421.1 cell division protein SepF [bacterium]HOL54814.1 cell division protein SepF [bacterium]HON72994.1 cell division protein SepF [bacterium]